MWIILLAATLAALVLGGLGAPAGAADQLAGDIVFIVDESSSMGDEIADVKARINDVAAGFEAQVDARYGLVAFGGAPPGQPVEEPFTRVNLTTRSAFVEALAGSGSFPIETGSRERGLFATTYAMTSVTGYRAGAGVCAVLISDEDPSFQVDEATDLAQAVAALKSRNAVWFGIVESSPAVSKLYGPDVGSLAASSGGAVFDIAAFRSNATPVLQALLSKCAQAISTRASVASFTANPTSGVAPLTVSFEAAADATSASYAWSFGDGGNGSGRTVTHTFTSPGTYTVTLTVTDQEGKTSSASQTIIVRPSGSGEDIVSPTDCTITGTAGNDVLVGTPGKDVICGLGGNDTIRGAGGADLIVGGLGNDVLKGGAGNDTLLGGPGNDWLFGGAGGDVLRGGVGDDGMNGGAGRDRLYGQAGKDRSFIRDGGRDWVDGGGGRDMAMVDGRIDVVRGVEKILR